MFFNQFRRSHHLIDPRNKILYCYIAKNACSTVKFHFLKKKLRSEGDDISEDELNARIHVLAKEHSIAKRGLKNLDDYYAFCIIREPRSRIASAFLDKFVQSKNLPGYARKLIDEFGHGKTPDTWTFSDFIEALAQSDLESFNEHWMPQYLHPAGEISYDFIPMENFSTHPGLREHYGDLSVNVRSHSLQYNDDGKPAHETPVQKLKDDFERLGVVPKWGAFCQPELDGAIRDIFGPDFELYAHAKARAAGEAPAKTISFAPLSPAANGDGAPSPAVKARGKPKRGKSKNNSLISVIVPVYGVENYIRQCMESLARQNDGNFEVVIVDDGSPDASADIAMTYADRIDKLRIHKQENRGLGGARNAGIAMAEGDYVTFVDSDDVVTPNLVSALRDRQWNSDAEIVTARFQLVSETLDFMRLTHEPPAPSLKPPVKAHERVLGALSRSVSCARLYSRDLLTRSGVTFPEKIPHEDLFFTYKVLRESKGNVFTNECLYSWRQRQGSLGRSLTQAHVDVLSALRDDTYRFLNEVGASEREFAFAARRNLSLATWFRVKARRTDTETRKSFLSSIKDRQYEIMEDIERYSQLKFPDDDLLIEKAERLLGEACGREAKQAARRVFACPGRFSSEPMKKETVAPVSGPDQEVDIAFFPLRAYHLRDCLPVMDALRQEGFRSVMIDTDDYRKGNEEVRQAADKQGIELIPLKRFTSDPKAIRCAVFFNDWDPLMRVISRICHREGIETVGWVEGVNDYHDADTGRSRYAYLRSRRVITPGDFDTKYFSNTGQHVYAGEVVRIRSLWEKRERRRAENDRPKALINSNFSYGVLVDHRDAWVRDAIEACLEAGFEPVLSRHPFDLGAGYQEYQTKESFFDVLPDCAVSIQRFGSGILESLATGVPVIYFNPHQERIDKFKSPENAYLIAEDKAELQAALNARRFFWKQDEAQHFLKTHTGLEESRAPGDRITQILKSIIEAAAAPTPQLARALAKAPFLKTRKSLADEANTIGPFYGSDATGAVTHAEAGSAKTHPGEAGLISVIVPVYNVENYIEKCLESLSAQDDDHFEVVIVDDGGDDESMAIVNRHAAGFEKLRVFKQENMGLGGARNAGISASQGEFIIFVDSDDILTRDHVSKLRRKQLEGDYDVVSGRLERISESGETLARPKEYEPPKLKPPLSDYEKVLGVLSPSVACARLYRKSVILDADIRFPNRIPHEDLFFTYKILRRATHAFIDDYIYFWRQRAESLSKSITRAHIDAWEKMRADTYQFLDAQSAGPREYALAARRNLVILENFRRKADIQKGDVLDYFEEALVRNHGALEDDYNRIQSSSVSAAYLPPELLARAALRARENGARPSEAIKNQLVSADAEQARPFYAAFGDKLRHRAPRIFGLARLLKRAASGLWRRRIWTLPMIALMAAAPLLSFAPALAPYRFYILLASVFIIAMAAIFYLGLRFYSFALGMTQEVGLLQSRLEREVKKSKRLTRENKNLENKLTKLDETLGGKFEQLRKTSKEKMNDTESLLRAATTNAIVAAHAGDEALKSTLDKEIASIDGAIDKLRKDLPELTSGMPKLIKKVDAHDDVISAFGEKLNKTQESVLSVSGDMRQRLDAVRQDVKSANDNLRDSMERTQKSVTLNKEKFEQAVESITVRENRLRERIASSERQIGTLRYPQSPSSIVFFGHHKCASRFFRREVFALVAEMTGARLRRYQIDNPPFHYSRMDELDLCNIDFDRMGAEGRDVVVFANSTERSLARIRDAAQDWRGVRVLRDPRQVLVSNYFHHKGGHDFEFGGWVWDQLKHDKPILQTLPEEDGLLHELDNISKGVIEEQLLAPFDDERVMTLKLEDFSKAPRGMLLEISAFLKVPDIAGLDLGHTFSNPDSASWEKHFTPKLKTVFKDRYGKALIHMGYAKDMDW
ncbi:glycosyltransferase [Hyphococcus sp.]|uniref:glycosyltransferase n=1 Tax=Hyphococcus sp. TaxID=2038636 RepID=UPI003CCBC97B